MAKKKAKKVSKHKARIGHWVFIIAVLFALLAGFVHNYDHKNIVFAVEKMPDNSRPAGAAVTDTTDVHYSGKYCLECHEQLRH